ncbi:hypothetical protein M8J75_015526 [Diaphorina citri]|nr:hypothetical protein M8J75_015526 [Diaphorina citri]
MSTTDIFVRDYPMCDEDDFENCKNMCFCRDDCTDSAAEFCLKWCYLEGGDNCNACCGYCFAWCFCCCLFGLSCVIIGVGFYLGIHGQLTHRNV